MCKISCITTNDDNFDELVNGNRFIGNKPVLKNSTINFGGRGNILYCEDNVTIQNSKIVFNGSNSVIYLSRNRHVYQLNITINNNQVFFMGQNNYMNGMLNVVLSEQGHIFIGSDGLFSFGIWLRNADPHLIYSSETMERINPTKSIFIGDHVWLGQAAMILKGTKIGSGSVVGAMSLLSGKTVPSNTCWGGNPAKLLKTGIFWDGSCVHAWTDAETQSGQTYSKDTYIFRDIQKNKDPFEEIDIQLRKGTAMDKLNFLLELNSNYEKDRFAIKGGS